MSFQHHLLKPQAPECVVSRRLVSWEYTAQTTKHYSQDAKLGTNLQSTLVPAGADSLMPLRSYGNSEAARVGLRVASTDNNARQLVRAQLSVT